jgi:putative RecB family exonuclease
MTIEPEFDWMRMQDVKDQARSVSAAKQYLESLGGCNYAYFLARVVRAWDRPAAWLPMGLGVHEAAEFWERSGRKAPRNEVIAKYVQSYWSHTDRLKKLARNTDIWFPSGPYIGTDDIDRRYPIGLAMVDKYLDYYINQKPGEVIWITPDGTPAIELGFSVTFGGVVVRGFIDQVLEDRVRDIKTGAKPGDTFQLKVYDLAIEDAYGEAKGRGDYWMGKTGKPTRQTYDLTKMSREQVTDLFGQMDEGVRAESFDPSPSPEKCRMCSVSSACFFAM